VHVYRIMRELALLQPITRQHSTQVKLLNNNNNKTTTAEIRRLSERPYVTIRRLWLMLDRKNTSPLRNLVAMVRMQQ